MQTVAVDQTAFIAGYKYTTERIRAIAGGSGHPNTTLRSLSVNQPELAKSSAVSGGGLMETGANSNNSFQDKSNVPRLTIQVRIRSCIMHPVCHASVFTTEASELHIMYLQMIVVCI